MERIEALEKKIKEAVRLVKNLKQENIDLKSRLQQKSSLLENFEDKDSKFFEMEKKYNLMKENQRTVKKKLRDLMIKINKYRR